MDDELLTVEEVAEKLKLQPSTIRNMLREKQFPGIKLGKREWRISAAALREFIEKGGQGTKGE